MEAVELKEQQWQSPQPKTSGNVAAPETGGSRNCDGTCDPGLPPPPAVTAAASQPSALTDLVSLAADEAPSKW